MTVNNSLITFLAAAMAILSGCQQSVTQPKQICPGKPTIARAAAVLQLQKQNAQPMGASADCTFAWRDEKDKKKEERVNGKMIFVPPGKIFFRGDKFGEIRFGANEAEFWLRVKPEMDSYWFGSKQQAAQCDETLLLNPAQVAEALGIVEITPDWKLSYYNGYDILSLHKDGKIKKRVYVNACDYRIERVEYFDVCGMKKVLMELADYWPGDDGLMVPSKIRIGYFDSLGLEESSVQIELKHIRSLPPEKQKKKLFQRPGRDGYEHLYRLNENCEFERLQ
ncbi:MAG: hypothetical protein B6I25_05505 [Planctomycetales bacterium 4572_13]|nr:MAG: hypothetical protein B6I25_05505 [Planctomycetales bacterium 4572_13]